MASTSKTFRIFVCSTFNDLKAERNALQSQVFPKLRELCFQHGCRFQAIDLRWGVREEAALDQQTMRICLDEIARCQQTTPRPNFIVLLGDRYGWRPLPSEIPAAEYEQIDNKVINYDEKTLLNMWYLRDKNSTPPVYCLQPREIEIDENNTEEEKRIAREKETKHWKKTESSLRQILQTAITDIPLTREQKLKYTASATEQEIMAGAMNVADASEHVFCFFRKIQGLPSDANAREFTDRDEKNGLDVRAQEKLENLKKRLRELLPENFYDYAVAWNQGSISKEYLDKLCQDVYRSLSQVILKEIEHLEDTDPLEQEIAEHKAFGKERFRFFVGREVGRKNIIFYIRNLQMRNAEQFPYAVFGASGSGKSTLMARAVTEVRREFAHACMITRFIGATPDSSNIRVLLRSICQQISRCYGRDESDIPSEYGKLVEEFPKRLAFASVGHPLIVFIDALDQLSDNYHARDLMWLPNMLPPNVRIVVSASPGECQSILRSRLQYPDPLLDMDLKGTRYIELRPMPANEGETLLDLWLENAGRTLQPNQKKEIIAKFNLCKLPLFLKMAFEEACCWKSYEKEAELNPDIPGIIRNMFTRLSMDKNHGEKIVSRALGYLAASKNGLSEDEIIDLLSKDSDVFNDFKTRALHEPPEQRLPVVVWSRLYFDLEPYLSRRTGDGTTLLTFYHRQLRESAEQSFLTDEEKLERHPSLANYFDKQKIRRINNGINSYNLRKLSELPYQQIQGKLWESLKTTLTDFNFIEAKIMTVGPEPLINDYELTLQVYSEAKSLRLVNHALKLSSHILSLDTCQLAGQLIGRLAWVGMPEIQKLITQAQSWHAAPWLRPLIPCLIQPGGPLVRTLAGHTATINGISITSDGKKVISASEDKTIKLWDLESGDLLTTLTGHTQGVKGVKITPDGRYIISASSDRTLKTWDLESAQELTTLAGHTAAVNGLDLLFEGRIVISVSDDKTLRFWNLQNALASNLPYLQSVISDTSHEMSRASAYTGLKTIAVTPDEKRAAIVFDDQTISVWNLEKGEELHSLAGHKDAVCSAVVTPDGKKVVSAAKDGSMKVWNLESGKEIRTIENQGIGIFAVAVTSDGGRAVTGQQDGTLKMWDIETGKELSSFKGHNAAVMAVTLSPDDTQAVSGSMDKTVRVWDLEMEEGGVTVSSHSARIRGAAVSPNGQLAVTGSDDKTLKIWDLKTGKNVTNLTGHTCPIIGVGVSHDGRRIISADSGGTIKIWDLEKGRELSSQPVFTDPNNPIETAVITLDGKQVATAAKEGSLKIWDTESGKVRTIRSGHALKINAVAVTPDGQKAVSGSADETLKVWELNSGKQLAALTGHKSAVTSTAVTPEGERAISGDISGMLKVWDLESGTDLASIQAHSSAVKDVALGTDGRRAVSCSEDATIRMWDLEEKRVLATFYCDEAVEVCSLSPDNRTIVAGGKSGRVYILTFIEKAANN